MEKIPLASGMAEHNIGRPPATINGHGSGVQNVATSGFPPNHATQAESKPRRDRHTGQPAADRPAKTVAIKGSTEGALAAGGSSGAGQLSGQAITSTKQGQSKVKVDAETWRRDPVVGIRGQGKPEGNGPQKTLRTPGTGNWNRRAVDGRQGSGMDIRGAGRGREGGTGIPGMHRGAGPGGGGNGQSRDFAALARSSQPAISRDYPDSETEDIIMPPRPVSPHIPWAANTVPFTSAYQYTIAHPDPRSTVPTHFMVAPLSEQPLLVDTVPDEAELAPEKEKETEKEKERLGKEIFTSWANSAPSPKAKRAVKRVLRDLNTSLAKHFRGHQFIVEPFGSVSWGAEASTSGDLDLVLRDFARPQGYTPDQWNKRPIEARNLPPFYRVYALADALRFEGYLEVNPIKWAAIPIGELNKAATNDLGGWMNSQLLLAYARVSPYLFRPLVHVVKSWAKARQLNDPSGEKGGHPSLSSYCWCLMVISYLQIAGKVPNLQDKELVDRSGRAGCGIYTNWKLPKGQLAEVAFAAGEVLESLIPEGAPEEGPQVLAEHVEGFFKFFASALAGITEPNAMHSTEFAFSVWQGGDLERYEYIDPARLPGKAQTLINQAAQELESEDALENDQAGKDVDLGTAPDDLEPVQQEIPTLERDHNPVLSLESQLNAKMDFAKPGPGTEAEVGKLKKQTHQQRKDLALAKPVEYYPEGQGDYCQPKKWAIHKLVVQDPLLHDKNCAGHISPAMYKLLGEEFARARDILSQPTVSLASLLEPAPPPISKRKLIEARRAAIAAATSAQPRRTPPIKRTPEIGIQASNAATATAGAEPSAPSPAVKSKPTARNQRTMIRKQQGPAPASGQSIDGRSNGDRPS